MECNIDNHGGHITARLSGQFIFTDHPTFKPILLAAENSAVNAISIDISRVEFIDSAGLGMLLLLRDMCEKHQKKLMILRPSGQVKKVFDISKFEHLFTIGN
jgi:anti-anti-sigma factor